MKLKKKLLKKNQKVNLEQLKKQSRKVLESLLLNKDPKSLPKSRVKKLFYLHLLV